MLKSLVRTTAISAVIAFTPLLRGQGTETKRPASDENPAMSIVQAAALFAAIAGASRHLSKGPKIEETGL